MSVSSAHLDNLLQDLDPDLETYGVEELRDGFFDATFLKPPKADQEEIMREARRTLPVAFKKKHPLSSRNFLPQQWSDIQDVYWNVTTTRSGIKLTKSFLAFFIAYILCLVPVIREWLGRYSYIMVISTILNHPGRTVGSQIDGTVLTILGTATGLGWGAFAIWLSSSSNLAKTGYGGILATFLVIFMAIIGALRSYYIRLYQFILCAGISVSYTCLADTSENVNWAKLFDYGIPWLFGQVICMLICCTIFPDAGARPLAVALHSSFEGMQEGLIVPQENTMYLHRRLAYTFVTLSQAYRDLVLEISITRFRPSDVETLRNLMQAVIRSLLALKMETQLFDTTGEQQTTTQPSSDGNHSTSQTPNSSNLKFTTCMEDSSPAEEVVITIDPPMTPISRTKAGKQAVKLVTTILYEPTNSLLACSSIALARCDAVLMEMSGYRKYLGPSASISSNIKEPLDHLREVILQYDSEEASLLANPKLPPTYSNHPEVIELFLFVRPIRQAASTIEALLVKVYEMQQRKQGWKLYLPSYPWSKAFNRTNQTVRHDRGGLTAGFYFRTMQGMAKTMKGMANVYKPLPQHPGIFNNNEEKPSKDYITRSNTLGKYQEEEVDLTNPNSKSSKKQKLRYKIWTILHDLQGFETRFALKVVIVTSLLSIPAWLAQSREWWNLNESWWAVVMAWIMLHPRVGGNIQDLITRALCGILGAVWGGVAYAAHNGNPYVMAVFAAIYMLPMIYRFTQSSHPRSGIVGCLSFIVVSLGAKSAHGLPGVVHISWTRGVAFVVGVVASVFINWILWPFVARHELRKALSAMLIYSSIIYRGVVAKYVYYEAGHEPKETDIERSEMLEGRLREGFVRIRQLLVSSLPAGFRITRLIDQALTRHEIRLRGPFNPLPHSALITSLEQFFEYLVSVRQSSLFFHPHYLSSPSEPLSSAAESLLSYRRDAVAAILMNLYVLAGALRNDRPVPRYLPSAAAARRRLLRRMDEIELEQAELAKVKRENLDGVEEGEREERLKRVQTEESERKWSQIYSYSYSQNFTGCVMQLEQLQKYTKEICGEQGYVPKESSLLLNGFILGLG